MCENVHLVKDVGMIPYMFHKNYDYKSVILTYKNGEYPYLDNEVKGLELQFLKKFTGFATMDVIIFLFLNARKIDILNCFHFMRSTLMIILAFRLFTFFSKKRKIYLKLDASVNFKSLIPNNIFDKFILKNINLVSVENLDYLKKLKNSKFYLNKKLIYIPNGYINNERNNEVSFDEKLNIIITVGRIGSEEKSNDILLKAFEKLDEKYSDWKLYFVGPIQNDFDYYTKEFISNHPKLEGRVILMGGIYDREELDNLYKKSKLFVLSSNYEGFPLVFLEALKNGCTIISTNFPSAYDIVAKQELDSLFNPQDIQQLSLLLTQHMNNDFLLNQNCFRNQKFAQENFKWEQLIEKINDELSKA
jgi:glycosyltransferase involved in cell wall biosynthesis